MRSSVKTSMIMGLTVLSVSCADNKKNPDEIVQVDNKEIHEFEVDEKSGKVEFKSEIVYFGFDQSFLTEEGIERLTALSNHMKANPKLDIKVAGHCDNRGSTEYNLSLGQKRAESVRKFLISTGLAEERLLTVSFGEEHPANPEASEKAYAENRRAEFTFVDPKSPVIIERAAKEKPEIASMNEIDSH